ncbi:uncharacterized protein [Miscanthus floridulus]|uniref:uncharacterized protein n=1 Tax=Miscanthus floridulus TaxID=154761 RepID=UPI00345A427E
MAAGREGTVLRADFGQCTYVPKGTDVFYGSQPNFCLRLRDLPNPRTSPSPTPSTVLRKKTRLHASFDSPLRRALQTVPPPPTTTSAPTTSAPTKPQPPRAPDETLLLAAPGATPVKPGARPSHRAALVKPTARTLGLGWNPTRSPCRSAGAPGAAGEKRSRHVEQQQLLQVLLHPHSLLPPGSVATHGHLLLIQKSEPSGRYRWPPLPTGRRMTSTSRKRKRASPPAGMTSTSSSWKRKRASPAGPIGNYELVSLLLETPSGFAIFSMYEHHFNDPDALENIWAHFGEEYRTKDIVWLKEFKTFKDKSSAINQDTGVNWELADMIMRCCYPSWTLAVGNMEYKRIIEKSLPVRCLFNETVMEVMRGLKNLMHVLVPGEKLKLTKRSPTNEPRTKMADGSSWLRCETRDVTAQCSPVPRSLKQ